MNDREKAETESEKQKKGVTSESLFRVYKLKKKAGNFS